MSGKSSQHFGQHFRQHFDQHVGAICYVRDNISVPNNSKKSPKCWQVWLAQHFEGFFPSLTCWWLPQIETTFRTTNVGRNVGSICADSKLIWRFREKDMGITWPNLISRPRLFRKFRRI